MLNHDSDNLSEENDVSCVLSDFLIKENDQSCQSYKILEHRIKDHKDASNFEIND